MSAFRFQSYFILWPTIFEKSKSNFYNARRPPEKLIRIEESSPLKKLATYETSRRRILIIAKSWD